MKDKRVLLAGLSQKVNISRSEHRELVESLDLDEELPFSHRELLEEGRQFLSTLDCEVVFLGEDQYPRLLYEIADPPKVLYYDGDLDKFNDEYAVSVVGTRRPSSYGRDMASVIGGSLGKLGISVVSGLAYGVDSLGQISCANVGVLTVGVLGESVDIWKKRNKKFLKSFRGNLLLLSEYFPGTVAKKYTFPERNRIIAGLTSTTIVVEARSRSGALITANLAFQYDRDVFAIPHPINSTAGLGCNELIRDNKARLLTSVTDLLSTVSVVQDTKGKMDLDKIKRYLDDTEVKIIDLIIEFGKMCIDDLATEIKCEHSNLLSILTKMESKGILAKTMNGEYKIILGK